MVTVRRRDLLAGAVGLGVLGGGSALAFGAVPFGTDGLDPVELETLDAPGSTAGTATIPERGRVTFVELFATWCTVCQSMMPRLAEVHETVDEDVQFLSVSNEPVGTTVSREEVAEWWADNGGAWPIALDSDLALTEQLDASGVPYAVVFDERNRVTWQHRGRARTDELVERIRSANTP